MSSFSSDRAAAASGSSDASPSSNSSSTSAEWIRRIQQQLSSRSPEAVLKAKRNAERQQRAKRAYHQSSKVLYANSMSSHAYAGSLQSMAISKAETSNEDDLADVYDNVTSSTRDQMVSLQQEMTREVAMDDAEEYQNEANSTGLLIADQLGFGALRQQNMNRRAAAFSSPTLSPYTPVSGESVYEDYSVTDAMATAVTPVAQSQMTHLLADLRIEPKNDAELAAKFEIYESGYQTVQKARETLMKFWADCSVEFDNHEQVKQSIEQQLRDLDKTQNLGIVDRPGEWFLYGMSLKVTKNTTAIDEVLRVIRTKLGLLASQTDCPICLEPFTVNMEVATLGCAHKVCSDCWSNWDSVCKKDCRPAFCPLCKQDAFVQAIVTMVP